MDICSAATLGNLFKSEQVLKRQITPEIKDGEAASSVAKVHAKLRPVQPLVLS
jgi:hypothetical protein